MDPRLSEQKALLEEYRQALRARRACRCHFDFCDPEYLDAAIFALGAAERRIGALIKTAKKEKVTAWRRP
ncbi:hypothetical protein [Ammonifex thiophilus]|uniref:DUF2508 family protein n=1 Tax=Ammonifex thiophilus TaxID=444093 RepID=A0A3D8P3F7_9THEO|nr:hypothetical protein [Ammonifex thiophilus]RDV81160.1 hypothetical protein DXX99_09965 [Ammonifex thiophilus]